MGFVFVLLEELDYGQHFIELFGGADASLNPEEWDRNIHNRFTSEGVQYGSYMKSVVTATLVFVFLVAPFLLNRSRFQLVRLFLIYFAELNQRLRSAEETRLSPAGKISEQD